MAYLSPEDNIIKSHSPAFWEATKLLPKEQRLDFRALYSFVRVTDNYVDLKQPDVNNFLEVAALWQSKQVITGETINQIVTKNIKTLISQHKIQKTWVDAFLKTMASDLKPQKFKTLKDSLNYTYGSAEVIGLMLAMIMGLPKKAYPFAKLQGRSWQWLNFIRDIKEDTELGRCYFPQDDLSKFGLSNLTPLEINKHQLLFKKFVRFQLGRYFEWSNKAKMGYKFIPSNCQQAIISSANKYDQLALAILKDPLIVIGTELLPLRQPTQALKHQLKL